MLASLYVQAIDNNVVRNINCLGSAYQSLHCIEAAEFSPSAKCDEVGKWPSTSFSRPDLLAACSQPPGPPIVPIIRQQVFLTAIIRRNGQKSHPLDQRQSTANRSPLNWLYSKVASIYFPVVCILCPCTLPFSAPFIHPAPWSASCPNRTISHHISAPGP